MRGVARVDMVLVGPNVRLDPGVAPNAFHDVTLPSARDDDGAPAPLRLRVAYVVGLYHEQAPRVAPDARRDRDDDEDEDERDEASERRHRAASEPAGIASFAPDVALAFNAGVWGYAPGEWRPSIERVLRVDKCPLVITGYTLEEAECDEDALEEMLFAPPRDPEGSGGEARDEGAAAGAAAAGGVHSENPFERGSKPFGKVSTPKDASASEEARVRRRRSAPGAVAWAWRAEANPFRSLKPRTLQFDRGAYRPDARARARARGVGGGGGGARGARAFMGENCAWQCLRPVAAR